MKDVLLIDKPAGWTSFDVVARVRSKIRADYTAQGVKPTKKQLRVGHAGTLDPFATGLLVVLLGDACKRAGEFLKAGSNGVIIKFVHAGERDYFVQLLKNFDHASS